MPRSDRNLVESVLETVLPVPIVDVLAALGRFVYAIVFSRSLDPDSWTASLVAPLVTLLLAYASLVVAYRTMRNTVQLAWFSVKYGALIGAGIALYSWWAGEAGGRVNAAPGAGGLPLNGLVGAIAGGGARGGVGGGGGALDFLRTLGHFGQGGVAALPVLGAILGHFQDQGGTNARQRSTRTRRTPRLRNNNNAAAQRRRAARAAAERRAYAHPALDLDDDDSDYYPSDDEHEEVSLRTVKNIIRWLGQATDADGAGAAGRRRAAANPLFPRSGSSSSSRRRRRQRSGSSSSELD